MSHIDVQDMEKHFSENKQKQTLSEVTFSADYLLTVTSHRHFLKRLIWFWSNLALANTVTLDCFIQCFFNRF